MEQIQMAHLGFPKFCLVPRVMIRMIGFVSRRNQCSRGANDHPIYIYIYEDKKGHN